MVIPLFYWEYSLINLNLTGLSGRRGAIELRILDNSFSRKDGRSSGRCVLSARRYGAQVDNAGRKHFLAKLTASDYVDVEGSATEYIKIHHRFKFGCRRRYMYGKGMTQPGPVLRQRGPRALRRAAHTNARTALRFYSVEFGVLSWNSGENIRVSCVNIIPSPGRAHPRNQQRARRVGSPTCTVSDEYVSCARRVA